MTFFFIPCISNAYQIDEAIFGDIIVLGKHSNKVLCTCTYVDTSSNVCL